MPQTPISRLSSLRALVPLLTFCVPLALGSVPGGGLAAALGPPTEAGLPAPGGPAFSDRNSLSASSVSTCLHPTGPAVGPKPLPTSTSPIVLTLVDPLHASLARSSSDPRGPLTVPPWKQALRKTALQGDTRHGDTSLRSSGVPGQPDSDSDRSQFGKALLGSAIGTAIGGLLTALLLSEAESEDLQSYAGDRDESEVEGVALLVAASGPPAGAILNTSVEQGNVSAWALGVLGEVLLGGAGMALGAAIGGSDRGQTIGALVLGAPGAAVGAAGGVTLAAPDDRGALRYSSDTDTWSTGLPAVRVRPEAGPKPGLTGEVSLVTMDL